MSGSGKRLWGSRLSLDDAQKSVFQFLKRCRDKNILTERDPHLFFVWRLDSSFQTQHLIDLSTYLRFGYDDNPQMDQFRNLILRLLVVAVKAHYFLDPQSLVSHEPYIFLFPDLAKPGEFKPGLIYPLEKDQKIYSFVIADGDLTTLASSFPKFKPNDRFPIILGKNSFKWLEISRWKALRQEALTPAQGSKGMLPWFDWRSWGDRKAALETAGEWKDASTFPFGTFVDLDKTWKEELQNIGAEWAKGIRHWFFPKGWDMNPTHEYLDFLGGLSEEQRYQQARWWQKLPYPYPEKSPDRNADQNSGNNIDKIDKNTVKS